MGKIQIAVVNVEGDVDTIREALKAGLAALDHSGNGHATLLPAPIIQPEAISAPPKAQRQKHGDFPCRYPPCEKMCHTAQARGKHEHTMHAEQFDKVVEQSSVKEYWCPVKNCGRSFKKEGWRDLHVERDHQIARH